jgi:hypothetical protein
VARAAGAARAITSAPNAPTINTLFSITLTSTFFTAFADRRHQPKAVRDETLNPLDAEPPAQKKLLLNNAIIEGCGWKTSEVGAARRRKYLVKHRPDWRLISPRSSTE